MFGDMSDDFYRATTSEMPSMGATESPFISKMGHLSV